MCEYGVYEIVNVKVPKDLSVEGIDIFKDKKIDSCIADLVQALQSGGIDMRGSCCGHGDTIGDIHLQDGRMLLVLDKDKARQWLNTNSNKERRELLRSWLNDEEFPLTR